MHRQVRMGIKKRKQQRVRESTAGRGAPSTRAENTPAAHRGTTLKQVLLSCSPWRTMVEQRPAWKPVEDPMLNQVDNSCTAACGKGSHWGSSWRTVAHEGALTEQRNCEQNAPAGQSWGAVMGWLWPPFPTPCTAWGRVQGSGTKLRVGKGGAEGPPLVF